MGSNPLVPATGSKLGAHILVMGQGCAEFIQAGTSVVKFAGDWGTASMCPPGTLPVGRKVLVTDDDAQQMRARGFTPAKAVQDFIFGKEKQIQTYQSNPAIKYWEGHNEPVWVDLDGMKWFADMEIARMQEMAKLGLKCIIGNFATGTPPIELWPGFLDALRAAKQYGAILGLHEYSLPWLWWMTGRYQMQVENCVDPRDPNRLEGWTTLRYRQVYRQFLEPAGLGDIPLIVTEFGIDPMVSPSPDDVPTAAWKDLGPYWNKHKDDTQFDYERQKYPVPPGVDFSGSKELKYFEQLKWYDREIRKDPYMIGATIFTFGSFGGAWERFDVAGTDVVTLLTAYVRQEKPVPNTPYVSPAGPTPPSPTPPSPTPPGPTPPTQPATIMVVQPDVTPYGGLKVRQSRSIDAPALETLPAGAQVTLLEGPVSEGSEEWVRIRTASGTEGWARPFHREAYLAPLR